MLQTFNEQNRDLVVYINGKLVHRDEAGVSPFDSSVQNGDAVWEGLRVYDGRVFRLDQHLDRLFKGAEMLAYQGMPTRDELVEAIRVTLKANAMRDGVHIRLTVSRGVKYTSGLDPRINQRGCSVFVLAEHKPPVYDKQGITLATASVRRPFADVLNQHIHSCNQLTSILAKLEANATGADDALMLDTAGNLAETNATHVFLIKEGLVFTPTTDACPEGVTRAAVLELCERHTIPFEVRTIPEGEVHAADAVFVTGTMGEIVPVVRIDQTQFPGSISGAPADLMARITGLFSECAADPLQGVSVA